jgi:hypothetical protein
MENNYKNLPIPAEIYDEMAIGCDSALQFDYDEETQTLRVHILSEDELETLAGHCAVKCGDCLWAESCDDAHGDLSDCPDFVGREGDGW